MPGALAFVGGMFSFGAGTAFAAGAATFTAWTAGAAFAGTIIGSLTVKLLTTVAVTALTQALAPDPPQGGGITIETTVHGEDSPETIVLGRYATGGQAICPPYSHGDSNRYLTHVIELCSAPGATLERVMIGEGWAEFGTTPHPDYGLPVLGDYEGHVWIRYYDGTQTAADPMLRDRYGSHPDRPWTAEMVGEGICYAILTFYYDEEDLPQVPRYRFEIGGIPLYDIRRDSTAGGAGPHRLADPATWEPSENPIVQAWNVMRGIRLPGGEIWGGNITDLRSLPTAVWIAAMNRCDVAVDIGGGNTEPAYRASLEVALNQPPAAALEELFKACAATIADLGYGWGITVGAPGLPVYTIGEGDVLVSRAQEADPFPALQDTYSAVSARFPDPRHFWETREAPLRTDPEAEASDAFGRRTASLALPAAPYHRQVQRLQRSLAKDNRRFRRHVISLPPDAAHVELIDTVAWNDQRNGYDDKVFSLYEVLEDPRTAIRQFSTRERNPNDYSWEPGFELPSAPGPGSPATRMPEQVLGFGAEGIILADPDGRGRRVGARLFWNPAISARGLRWQIRLTARPQSLLEGDTQQLARGELVTFAGVLKDRSYEARARLISGRRTIWTDWMPFTTGNAGFGWDDFEAEVREAVDDALAQAEAAADAAAAANAEHAIIRGELDAATDELQADIAQARTDLGADIAAVEALAMGNLDLARDYTDTSVLSEAAIRQSATDALAVQIQTLTAVLNSANYLENPRFSAGLTGWAGNVAQSTVVAQDDGSGDPVTANAPTSHFVSVSTSASTNRNLHQDFPVEWETSEVFQWRVHAAAHDAGRQARVLVYWYDDLGAQIGSAVQTVLDLIEDEWRVFSGQHTPPADAVAVRFQLRVPANASAEPVAFADASFTKVDQSAIARITDLEVVVAGQGAAQAAWNSAATARLDGNEGAITAEASTRATQDGVLSGRIDAVEATGGANSAAITAEATARTTADSALSGQITTVSAAASRARTFRGASAPASPETGDIWYDTSSNRQAYRWNGSAWQAVDDARIAQNAASITAESVARADADGAMAAQITTVSAAASRARTFRGASAPASPETGDIWYDTSSNRQAYRWNGSAWQAVDDARIAETAATVTTQASTIAGIQGNLAAGYLIRTQAGNAVSLIDLVAADGSGPPSSIIKVKADDILFQGSVGMEMLTLLDLTGNMVPDAEMVSPTAWSITGDWLMIPDTSFNWNRGESAGEVQWRGAAGFRQRESVIFSVLQGIEYRLDAKLRHIASTGTTGTLSARIAIVWLDVSGGEISVQQIVGLTKNTGAAGNNHAVSGANLVAPVGARKAKIRLNLWAENQVHVGFNSISCVRKRTGNTLITPGSVTSDLVTADTMRALLGQFVSLEAANLTVGNAEIDTAHIRDGAVATYWAANADRVTITVSYRTKLLIQTNVRVSGSGGGWAINYELRVGGNPVDTAVFSVSPYSWAFPWFKTVTVDPGTYTIRHFYTGDGGNSFSNYRTSVFGIYV